MFKISFIDVHGMEESGIDGGGLQKEFITTILKYLTVCFVYNYCRQGFDLNYGLF